MLGGWRTHIPRHDLPVEENPARLGPEKSHPNPPRNESSPFASFRGHHVGLRVEDFEAARD
jgi:hypothetical protein